MPDNPHTLAVRWIRYSNFELVYNGHILLLDAYYDRGGFFTNAIRLLPKIGTNFSGLLSALHGESHMPITLSELPLARSTHV
jgi:hypothetical protein